MNPIKELFFQIPGAKTVNALHMVRRAGRIVTDGSSRNLVAAQLDAQSQIDARRGLIGFGLIFAIGGSLSLIFYNNETTTEVIVCYTLALSSFVDAGLACLILDEYPYGV